MILEIAICVLIADFITGIIHWLEDTYGVPSWPLIGSAVIVPNIEHHRNPLSMTMGSIISRNWQPILFAFTVLLISHVFGLFTWHFALIVLLASIGNEVHAWNHRSSNPWWIQLIQDTAIIQTRRQHALHHKPPYNIAYCTLTNLLNPILDRIRFWRFAEWILFLLGINVKRCSTEREGY